MIFVIAQSAGRTPESLLSSRFIRKEPHDSPKSKKKETKKGFDQTNKQKVFFITVLFLNHGIAFTHT